MVVTCFHFFEDYACVHSLEWQIAADKGVEKDTQGPDVGLMTVATINHFWCHVVWCTGHCIHLFVAHSGFRKTKVDEAHRIILRNHDVVRLDITMHDIHRMAVIQRLKQLSHVLCSSPLCEHLVRLLRDFIEESLTCHVLHHQVDELRIIVRFVVLDDVGVVEIVQDIDLFYDVRNAVTHFLLVQHFDSNLKILIMLVRSLKHAAVCTCAKNFCLRVDVVVLLELCHALLLVSFTNLY